MDTDSGSEGSILSKTVLDKVFPDWETFPNFDFGPSKGVGGDGEMFNLVGNKMFLEVRKRGNFKLGINLLKLFSIRLIFDSKIKVFF